MLYSAGYRCSDRHFVTPSLDAPKTFQEQLQLPAQGRVKVRFTVVSTVNISPYYSNLYVVYSCCVNLIFFLLVTENFLLIIAFLFYQVCNLIGFCGQKNSWVKLACHQLLEMAFT